ncbi:MAG TPA: glycosyltransferase family 9 protein [Bacteroidia bacterium]|nr:glycosyltransferase family 9 protein [Bacteroidia bacterium]
MPKFLIIRFSSIGDIVLTTPVIRCLKQQVKDADVHFALKRNFSEVLEHNPYIDKKYFLEDDLSSLISKLKKEKYDYIIDLHHNQRTFIIKQRLRVKSFSFNKLNFEKWLLVNFKINRLPNVSIVDRYMKTVESFGVKNDGKGLDYFISTDDEKIISSLPENFRNGFFAFVIGAKHYTKQLPAEKIISVCQKISLPIVLLGGKEDIEKGEEIIRGLTSNFKLQTQNLCGKFSLNQSAAIIRHSKKVITHDTGLMHIAAAFKKEIISVWGNTVPEFGMAPYYGDAQIPNPKSQILILPCRPCTKIGYEKCPKGHFKCMLLQDENEIAESVNAT